METSDPVIFSKLVSSAETFDFSEDTAVENNYKNHVFK